MRNHAVILAFVLALSAGAPAVPAAAQEPAREQDIVRLLETTGTADAVRRTIDQLIPVVLANMKKPLKRQYPNIPERVFGILEEEIAAAFKTHFDDLIAAVVPVYAKHFSRDEIGDIIAFYETPTGRKLVRLLPEMQNDSVQAVGRWANGIVPEVQKRFLKRVREAGIEL